MLMTPPPALFGAVCAMAGTVSSSPAAATTQQSNFIGCSLPFVRDATDLSRRPKACAASLGLEAGSVDAEVSHQYLRCRRRRGDLVAQTQGGEILRTGRTRSLHGRSYVLVLAHQSDGCLPKAEREKLPRQQAQRAAFVHHRTAE